MAQFTTTIHHHNYTAVGRGWSVTVANMAAIRNYLEGQDTNEYLATDIPFLTKLANEARAAKRGMLGLAKLRLDRDKSFIEIERI